MDGIVSELARERGCKIAALCTPDAGAGLIKSAGAEVVSYSENGNETVFYAGAADMRALFSNSNAVFMFLTAILTMRLLSEERGKKTDQLLLTSPVSVWEIVIGKYLAAVCVFLTALVISLCMPGVLFFFGRYF